MKYDCFVNKPGSEFWEKFTMNMYKKGFRLVFVCVRGIGLGWRARRSVVRLWWLLVALLLLLLLLLMGRWNGRMKRGCRQGDTIRLATNRSRIWLLLRLQRQLLRLSSLHFSRVGFSAVQFSPDQFTSLQAGSSPSTISVSCLPDGSQAPCNGCKTKVLMVLNQTSVFEYAPSRSLSFSWSLSPLPACCLLLVDSAISGKP